MSDPYFFILDNVSFDLKTLAEMFRRNTFNEFRAPLTKNSLLDYGVNYAFAIPKASKFRATSLTM